MNETSAIIDEPSNQNANGDEKLEDDVKRATQLGRRDLSQVHWANLQKPLYLQFGPLPKSGGLQPGTTCTYNIMYIELDSTYDTLGQQR